MSFELAEINAAFAERAQVEDDSGALLSMIDELVLSGEIRPEVLPESLDESREDFLALELGEQKQIVMELLNKNHLYVAYADKDDKHYAVSDEDKAFSVAFYGEGAE